MKKLFLICSVMCVLGLNITKAQTYNFADYIYPFGYRTYISQNSEGRTTSVSQFSFLSESYDNYIGEEVYIAVGTVSAKNVYRYHTEKNTVVSDVQLRKNALTGTTKYQDKLILFAFPDKDKPYTWSEVDRGDKISGKSEYVYITIRNERKKAIKITKTTYTTNHKYEEKSYWVEGYGRIATFESMDGGKESVSSRTDSDELYYGTNFNPKE